MELLEISETSELYRTIRTLHHWTEQVVISISQAMGEDVQQQYSNSPPRKIRTTPREYQQGNSPPGARAFSPPGTAAISSSPPSDLSECPLTLGSEVVCEGKVPQVEAKDRTSSTVFRTGWRTMVGYYFNEVLNFPECMEQTYSQLVDRISYQTSLERQVVSGVLERLIDEASATTDCGMPGYRANCGEEIATVQVGMLNFRMTRTCYLRLQRSSQGNNEVLIRLFLRYFPLGPGGGFFWSIDPSIYAWLSCKLPVLECFASPFNFNTERWCSPFQADTIFGSQGNFFQYIEKLDVPMRLVVNPPYTHQMLERTTTAVLSYLKRVQGAEAILTYPCWNYLECYGLLQQWPNCSSVQLEKGNYNLYDYGTGRKIVTPMSLTFYILGSEGHIPQLDIQQLQRQITGVTEAHLRSEGYSAVTSSSVGSGGASNLAASSQE